MRLLFVEDHERFARLVIRQFLGEHEVTVAPTLAAARRELVARPYYAVLLDYDLPDGKGVELLPDLERHGLAERVVGVSSREENNAPLVARGAAAVVSKMDFRRIEEVLARLRQEW
jgi:two-component system, OmpR family, response regulator